MKFSNKHTSLVIHTAWVLARLGDILDEDVAEQARVRFGLSTESDSGAAYLVTQEYTESEIGAELTVLVNNGSLPGMIMPAEMPKKAKTTTRAPRKSAATAAADGAEGGDTPPVKKPAAKRAPKRAVATEEGETPVKKPAAKRAPKRATAAAVIVDTPPIDETDLKPAAEPVDDGVAKPIVEEPAVKTRKPRKKSTETPPVPTPATDAPDTDGSGTVVLPAKPKARRAPARKGGAKADSPVGAPDVPMTVTDELVAEPLILDRAYNLVDVETGDVLDIDADDEGIETTVMMIDGKAVEYKAVDTGRVYRAEKV